MKFAEGLLVIGDRLVQQSNHFYCLNIPNNYCTNNYHLARKRAYKLYTFEMHGFLGENRRIKIPHCVLQEIRNIYPDSYGKYELPFGSERPLRSKPTSYPIVRSNCSCTQNTSSCRLSNNAKRMKKDLSAFVSDGNKVSNSVAVISTAEIGIYFARAVISVAVLTLLQDLITTPLSDTQVLLY